MTTADKLTRLKTDFDDVYNKAYEQGKAEGSTDSYYDTFWDVFQQNGERTDYASAFSNGYFNVETFKPKYDLKPTNCKNMFSCFPDEVDLREILNECGVFLDFSNIVSVNNYAFNKSEFTALPVINCPTGIYQWFSNCTSLHTIEKLILNRDINATYLNGFINCTALKNIVIEGEIGDSISFKDSSLLTVESAKSVITHLVNYSGTEKEFACSVIFHSDVWTRLDALGNDSPNGNTWREYVNDLGWNAS